MAKTEYLVGEAFTNLRRNALVVTGAVLAVFVSLALAFGARVVQRVVEINTLQWQEGTHIIVFLQPDGTQESQLTLLGTVQDWQEVEEAWYVSKLEAYDEFKEMFAGQPALIEEVDASILPPSIRIKLTDLDQHTLVRDQLVGNPAVKEIVTAGDTIEQISSTSRVLNTLFLGLSIILGISSVILIANTIRMAIYARREEIEIMKLVGASNWFIRLPYLLEGLIEGLVGALLAVIAVWFAHSALRPLSESINLVNLSVDTQFLVRWGVIILAFGAAAGVLGSGLGIRRFLRV
ncbi:MAG: cell division protein FtsX [Acidimicrobiia bacterium]